MNELINQLQAKVRPFGRFDLRVDRQPDSDQEDFFHHGTGADEGSCQGERRQDRAADEGEAAGATGDRQGGFPDGAGALDHVWIWRASFLTVVLGNFSLQMTSLHHSHSNAQSQQAHGQLVAKPIS